MLFCQIMNIENNSIAAQSLSENEFIFPFSERYCVVFLPLNYFLYSRAQNWRYFNITSVSEIPKWKVALQRRGIFFRAEWNALMFKSAGAGLGINYRSITKNQAAIFWEDLRIHGLSLFLKTLIISTMYLLFQSAFCHHHEKHCSVIKL